MADYTCWSGWNERRRGRFERPHQIDSCHRCRFSHQRRFSVRCGLALTPLETHTRREDIYEAIKEMLSKRGIDQTKLVSVTTDGVPVLLTWNVGLMHFVYLKCRPNVPVLFTWNVNMCYLVLLKINTSEIIRKYAVLIVFDKRRLLGRGRFGPFLEGIFSNWTLFNFNWRPLV